MTERRRRPHPALGARWVSAGLAVAATVGITSYLEIDSVLHPTPLATIAPPTVVPGTARIAVPPPPPVTVTTISPVTAPVYVVAKLALPAPSVVTFR